MADEDVQTEETEDVAEVTSEPTPAVSSDGRDMHGFLPVETIEDEPHVERLKREQLATFEREVVMAQQKLALAEEHGGDVDRLRAELSASVAQFKAAGGEVKVKQTRRRGG